VPLGAQSVSLWFKNNLSLVIELHRPDGWQSCIGGTVFKSPLDNHCYTVKLLFIYLLIGMKSKGSLTSNIYH